MELRFRVMAKSDAHIVLTTSPLVLNPLYEIVIGASGNNYTGSNTFYQCYSNLTADIKICDL